MKPKSQITGKYFDWYISFLLYYDGFILVTSKSVKPKNVYLKEIFTAVFSFWNHTI